MKNAIPVLEIMAKDPVTLAPDATVLEAARAMRDRDVGSLLVVRDGKPVGIVTEKDLVTKVVAGDLQASGVRVADVMTSPLVTVEPYQEVLEAAKRMAELGIRRLPVVEGGNLVGLVTENDILRVWPALIEITRERAAMAPSLAVGVLGYCESCATYSDRLNSHNGQLLCPECREE